MFKSIYIKNFKAIKDIKIEFNEQFNVIIGVNNIGKTTVFEAIRLWKLCYDNCIQKSNQKKFYADAKNILFSDSESLRVFEDKDLYNVDLYNVDKNFDIEISIEIVFENNTYNLGFKIAKAQHIDDAYLQLSYIENSEFKKFTNEALSNFNLNNIFVISDSRAIANIVAKEPYMYRAQVREKINKGKGYDVLRNKIVANEKTIEGVQAHLNNIFGYKCDLKEKDKEKKTYINLFVNGTNILSQGSGFIQIAEIFSSIEYMDTGRFILLIDEPDAHLHVDLQRKLVNELKTIEKSQSFVISHNKEFISCVDKNEIIHLTKEKMELGEIVSNGQIHINEIIKSLNGGNIDKTEKLSNAKCIVLCEGKDDVEFINNLLDKYECIVGNSVQRDDFFMYQIQGIDTLNEKLLSYSRAYEGIANPNAKWIIIRDSDCLPISRHVSEANVHKKHIRMDGHDENNDEVIFQKGYGLESTFFSDIDKLVDMLNIYYELSDEVKKNKLKCIVEEKVETYLIDIRDCIKDLHIEYKKDHLERQQGIRKNYADVEIEDIFRGINGQIEYILTKKGIDRFLREVHNELNDIIPQGKTKLNHKKIVDFYFTYIDTLEMFYDCHVEIIEKIMG